MSSESIQHLFARTLEGDYDSDEAWDAVRELQRRGTQDIFEFASQWCEDPDPRRRARGADVLAQLGKTAEHGSNRFPVESFAVLSRMVTKDTEIGPLRSAIFALGHLDHLPAVPLISLYGTHTKADIRYAVACALGSYPNDPRAIPVLMKLTADPDEAVRDWATFGLGVLGAADTVPIRDALVTRLSDPNEEAREEAVVALAKRQDQRTLPYLLKMLDQPEPSCRAMEAASFLLGEEREIPKKTATEYITALQQRFS